MERGSRYAGGKFHTRLPTEAKSAATAPTGPAGGDLTGAFPNPTVAPKAIGTGKLADDAVTATKLADDAVGAGRFLR